MEKEGYRLDSHHTSPYLPPPPPPPHRPLPKIQCAPPLLTCLTQTRGRGLWKIANNESSATSASLFNNRIASCLSACLSPTSLPVHLSTSHLSSVCPSTGPPPTPKPANQSTSARPSSDSAPSISGVHLSVLHLIVCQPICPYLSVHLSTSTCLSQYLSVCLALLHVLSLLQPAHRPLATGLTMVIMTIKLLGNQTVVV